MALILQGITPLLKPSYVSLPILTLMVHLSCFVPPPVTLTLCLSGLTFSPILPFSFSCVPCIPETLPPFLSVVICASYFTPFSTLLLLIPCHYPLSLSPSLPLTNSASGFLCLCASSLSLQFCPHSHLSLASFAFFYRFATFPFSTSPISSVPLDNGTSVWFSPSFTPTLFL